jgi:hypothetical protein
MNWPSNHYPLEKLNSITKYPSVPTFHRMGERARLSAEVPTNFDPTEDWEATEKIDGTNGRIIFTRYGDFIGSRDVLLTFTHDVVRHGQPHELAIMEELLPVVLRTTPEDVQPSGDVLVVWGEVYGGNVGKACKNYSADGRRGFRLFDAALFTERHWIDLHRLSLEEISRWRERGGQPFVSRAELEGWSGRLGVPTAPVISLGTGPLPTQLDHTGFWLGETLPGQTAAGLDAQGAPEGLVLRNRQRTKIVKLRTEDYLRYLRTLRDERGRAVNQRGTEGQ